MDILRKELNAIYAAQELDREALPPQAVGQAVDRAGVIVGIGNGCAVVTDAAADRCHICPGAFGRLMGFGEAGERVEFGSSDEDVIYCRIHPEDLVEKRMLEYEFFRHVDKLAPEEKMFYKATCRLRIKDGAGNYRYVDNSTRLLRLSPGGKIWLILCCYDLSPVQTRGADIEPRIVNNSDGTVMPLSFTSGKANILTPREKEILSLIRGGSLSKQIAAELGISVNTVNRPRQNIIEKLSVGNSVEAVAAALAMKPL